MFDYTFRVRAEINLDAIRENIMNLSARINSGCKKCIVVKADGYGHGAVKVAEAVVDLADFFGVATFDEALALRDADIAVPILILGYIHESANELSIENDIRMTVFSFDAAKKISEAAAKVGRTAKIHIKINTGMNRIGFRPTEESIDEIIKIANLPGIEIEGIFTHLFSADAKDKDSSCEQIKIFNEFTDKLKSKGIAIPIKHCANSAGAISVPGAKMDMVRLGIAVYGLYPSDNVKEVKLHAALSLKSHIVMIKTIKEGETVGYGAVFKAKRDTVIATVPVGYADGFKRPLFNRGCVLIRGKRAPIVGRVCMDQLMADVTDIEGVCEFDEVTLIGRDKDEELSMEEVSTFALSFNYEFACGIGRRVPRIYIRSGS